MINRAVVLPSVGDPLLLNLWLKYYIKNIKSSVDTIYLKMTNYIDNNARNYIINKFQDIGAKVWFVDYEEQHGTVLKFLLEKVQEETLVLLEDDFFVLVPGALNESFKKIEDRIVDCIGSTRNCCTQKVIQNIANTFNLSGSSPEHNLRDCPNFWPCLFFAKTETLRKTDSQFGAICWKKGETIPYINMMCDVDEVGDSFVWASIQLRGHGNRFGYIHQCHTAPNDLMEFPRKLGIYSFKPLPWVHIGSLSSGVPGLIKYDNLVVLTDPQGRDNGRLVPYPVVDNNTVLEYTRRIAMFKFIADYGKLEDPKLDYFNQVYANGVERAIQYMGLSRDKVNEFYNMMEAIFLPKTL